MGKIHQSYFVMAMSVGVIIGAILALIFRINYFASPWWLVFALILIVVAYLDPRVVFLAMTFVAGMVLIFCRVSGELVGANFINALAGEMVQVQGTVRADPKMRNGGMAFELVSLAINGEEVSGNIYISAYKNSEIKRGDVVELIGKMETGFGAYVGYMYHPRIEKVARPSPGDITVRARDFLAEQIKSALPERPARLGLSYLLGMGSLLPEDLSADLKNIGLAHVVVASGAHLSILVGAAKKIFGAFSRLFGTLMAIVFILFFMTMIGFTPSIMRAGVMAIVGLLAAYVGRRVSPVRVILVVAAITLLVNPMFLVDLGWLLSFASYAGITMVAPKLKEIFFGDKKIGLIASTIVTTVAATITTLPITVYYFGNISLLSVVANLLILPTLGVVMGLVFFAGVLAVVPVAGVVCAFVAAKILEYHILVVNFLGKQEVFIIKMARGNPRVFLWYAVLLALAGWYFFKSRKKRRI